MRPQAGLVVVLGMLAGAAVATAAPPQGPPAGAPPVARALREVFDFVLGTWQLEPRPAPASPGASRSRWTSAAAR
jgi:hypothetical protein